MQYQLSCWRLLVAVPFIHITANAGFRWPTRSHPSQSVERLTGRKKDPIDQLQNRANQSTFASRWTESKKNLGKRHPQRRTARGIKPWDRTLTGTVNTICLSIQLSLSNRLSLSFGLLIMFFESLHFLIWIFDTDASLHIPSNCGNISEHVPPQQLGGILSHEPLSRKDLLPYASCLFVVLVLSFPHLDSLSLPRSLINHVQ